MNKNNTNNGNESCINQTTINLSFPFYFKCTQGFATNYFIYEVVPVINNSPSEKIQSDILVYMPSYF